MVRLSLGSTPATGDHVALTGEFNMSWTILAAWLFVATLLGSLFWLARAASTKNREDVWFAGAIVLAMSIAVGITVPRAYRQITASVSSVRVGMSSVRTVPKRDQRMMSPATPSPHSKTPIRGVLTHEL